MKARVFAWLAASTLVATTYSLGTSGCSADPSSTGGDRDTSFGTVSAALSAVGPDGATYTLESASLGLTPTALGGVSGTLVFSNAPGAQSFSVAAGSYVGTLTGGPIDGAVGWTLSRQSDAGPTSVSAVLLDPQPYSIVVSPGATTALTLHFEVANVGTIVFSAGTITTTLSVDAGTLPPGHAAAAATVSFPQTTFSTPSASLNTLLSTPAAGSGAIPFAITITLTSPFQLAVDQACANVTASVTATAVPDGGTEDAYAAWLQEVNGATGTFCFNDAASPFGPVASMLLNRNGPPVTPAFQGALGATANAAFQLSLAQTTSPAYLANGVLSLGALSQPVQLPLDYLTLTVSSASDFAQAITGGQSTTLQISP